METTRRYQAPRKITRFSEAFKHAQHINHRWSNGSDYAVTTQRNYDIISQQCREFGDPDPKLVDMTNAWMVEVLRELQEKRELQDKTLNRYLATIRHTMYSMVTENYLDFAPKYKSFPEDEGRTNWYRPEQVDRLVELAIERGKFGLADVTFAAPYCGLRMGELLRLKVRDVDLKHDGVLHVGGTPDTRTKAKNYRTVGISDKLVPLLEKRVAGRDRTDAVFGEWNNCSQLSRQFRSIRDWLVREDLSVDNTYCFHTLRHSYGTWMIQAKQHLMDVSWAMGHKNVKTTEKYLHNSNSGKRQMAQAI